MDSTAVDIATLLRSTRIRERNDALEALESALRRKQNLPGKALNLLVQAIFDLVQKEIDLLDHNETPATAQRLSRASEIIRSVTELAVTARAGSQEAPDSKYKAKTLISIAQEIIKRQNSRTTAVFSSCLAVLLKQQFVRDHLNYAEWMLCYEYCVEMLAGCEPNQRKGFLDCLVHLIAENTTSYVEVYDVDFGVLFDVLARIIEEPKIDQRLALSVLRIANKLISMLCYQDSKNTCKFIRLGFTLVTRNKYNFRDASALNEQIVVFLNLSPVYTFSASNWTELGKDKQFGRYLQSVVDEYFAEIASSGYSPNRSDFGSFIHYNNTPDLFRLHTTYLNRTEPLRWLFFSGLSRLIRLYYKLSRAAINDDTADFPHASHKKRKVAAALTVEDARDCQSLYIKLVQHENKFLRTVGLILVHFHLELSTDDDLTGPPTADWNSSLLAGTHQSLLELVIGSLGTIELHFWVLLVVRSYLFRAIQSKNALEPNLVSKTIIVLLQHLNRDYICDQTCLAFCTVMDLVTAKAIPLSQVFDQTIVTQLENVVSLSEVSGPNKISNSSFQFWYTLHKVYKSLSLRADSLQDRIKEWFFAKWDTKLNPSAVDFCSDISSLGDFLRWLVGGSIPRNRDRNSCSYNGPLNVLTAMFSSFDKVMAIKAVSATAVVSVEREVIAFESKLNIHFLLQRMLDLQENVIQTGAKHTLKFASLLHNLGCSLKDTNENFYNTATYTMINVIKDSDPISLVEWNEFLASLSEDGSLKDSEIEGLLKETFKTIFRKARSETPKEQDESLHPSDMDFEVFSVLENEFTGSRRTDQELKTIEELSLSSHINTDTVKAIIKYHRTAGSTLDQVVSEVFAFVHTIETTNVAEHLYCLYVLISSIGEKEAYDLDTLSRTLLVRFFGEGPLSFTLLDRAEVTIFSITRLLNLILPTLSESTDESLVVDCVDLTQWLLQLGKRGLFLTDNCCLEFMKLLLTLMKRKDFVQLAAIAGNLDGDLFNLFGKAKNIIRIGAVESINSYSLTLSHNAQMVFYQDILTASKLGSDIEIDSLFHCAFVALLNTTSLQIRNVLIFDILQFYSSKKTTVSSLDVVITNTFCYMCERMNIEGPHQLFGTFRLDILRSCCSSFENMNDFPHFVFGYTAIAEFMECNREYIVALLLSSNLKHKGSVVWEPICGEEPLSELVQRCLSLTIPLAYSKGGYRNEIHHKLKKIVGDQYPKLLKKNLITTILKTLELTDFGDENAIVAILNKSIVYHTGRPGTSKVFEPSSEITIPFRKGYTLINDLIKEFCSFEEFWVHQNLYLLVQHTISVFKSAISDDTRATSVRKLKFLMVTGIHYGADARQIYEMILRRVAPYLSDSKIHDEVCGLLVCLSATNWHNNISGDLVISALCVLSKSKLQAAEFLDSINCLIAQAEMPVPLCTFLRFAIYLLRKLCKPLNNSMEIDTTECFEIVNDDASIRAARIHNSHEYLIQIMSFCFEHAPSEIEPTTTATMIEVLLSTDITKLSDHFKKWAAESLALYYLKHGTSSINEILTFDEVPQASHETDFSTYILDVLLHYLDDENMAIANLAYVTLGRIKNEDKALFGEHNAIALLSNTNWWLVCNHGADLILERSSEEQHVSWASLKCQYLLKEMASEIPWLQPLERFIDSVPGSALEVTPYLVGMFIERFSQPQVIIALFKEYVTERHLHEKSTCRMLLQTCLLIRNLAIRPSDKKTLFASVYADLDILGFAGVACQFNAFESSLMLLEESLRNEGQTNGEELHETTLRTIYESIDNEDMVHGLPEQTTLDYAIQKIRSTTEASRTIEFDFAKLDSSILQNENWHHNSLVHSMMEQGYVGAASVIGGSSTAANEDQRFEWSWKLNQWNLPAPSKPATKSQFIYKSLVDLQQNGKAAELKFNESVLVDALQSKASLNMGLISSKEVRQKTKENLELMGILYGIRNAVSTKTWADVDQFNLLTSRFDDGLTELSDDVLFARFITFRILSTLKQESDNFNSWTCSINELTRYIDYSRVSGSEQKMVNSAVLLDDITRGKAESLFVNDIKSQASKLSKFQSARTLWSQSHTSVAVSMLRDLQGNGIKLPIEKMNVASQILRATLVGWVADSRQEVSSKIMDRYVLPTAEQTMEDADYDITTKAKVFDLLAKFCEKQSQSRNLNDAIEKLEKRVSTKLSEIQQLKSHYSTVSVPISERKVVQKYYSKLKAQYSSELKDLEDIKNTKLNFCKKAIEYYFVSICNNDDSDESIDKFFSLWLEHPSFDDLNKAIMLSITNVSTFRLVSWSSQLCSRLSKETSLFQDTLKVLIKKFCKDHPYHSLYHLVSLKKQEEDGDKSNQVLASKAVVATEIWDSLKTFGSKYTKQYLTPIERFSDEALRLASLKISRGKVLNLSTAASGTYWIGELPKIPPPTLTFAPNPSANYENVPTMIETKPQVTIANSGLSLPKIVTFVMSDFKTHKTIFKYGTDDLRQDAIMEQVFDKVNSIFQKNRETMKRKLRVRTYKIVPIGPKAGVIEFVPDSLALIDIIKPYHNKKDKMKLEKARELMKEVQTSDRTTRVLVYDKICAQVKPQLGCFFFDTFLTPREWFASRVKYSHGMATSSMVGHILGLGDRHCNNILLDKASGEPIHIDLGVAFDQGRRLPIPETVPFRLTRDMVDGLGISGVEGIFRRNSEHTFRVLRHNEDHIIAILDILRYDPLYSWNLSPLKKQLIQQDDIGNVGEKNAQDDTSEAGRAIQMVKDKLSANGLSVEASVRELIQEATNTENLAVIYCGWCPFY